MKNRNKKQKVIIQKLTKNLIENHKEDIKISLTEEKKN